MIVGRWPALIAGLLVLAACAASASYAEAKPKAKRTARARPICAKHKTKSCVRVPKGYRKPKRNQNAAKHPQIAPVPRPTGLGGGTAPTAAGAVTWARNQLGRGDYAGLCLRFVADAYAVSDVISASAAGFLNDHRAALQDKHNPERAPAGALVLFRADERGNGGLGHIGISLGGGKMISASSKVEIDPLTGKSDQARYWNSLYAGWIDAPATWPGRYQSPPPAADDPVKTQPKGLEMTAPAAEATVSGTLEIDVTAPDAPGVQFEAYFNDGSATSWHVLGTDRLSDQGRFSLLLDTHGIPDQGDGASGTVKLAAYVLDADGNKTGAPDQRRVTVQNQASPTPTPTPTPAPPEATPTPTPAPPPPPSPSVAVGKGAAIHNNQCTNSSCAYIVVNWANFGGGTHAVKCYSSGEGFIAGYNVSGGSGSSATCYFGFPRQSVWATVDGVQSPSLTW